jgi:hypothetical protein
MGDQPNAAVTGEDVPPRRRHVVADRTDDAEPGDHYTPLTHGFAFAVVLDRSSHEAAGHGCALRLLQ